MAGNREAIGVWVTIAGKIAVAYVAVLYGVLRLANSWFYTPLGVRPEEVGASQAEILAQSVTGFLIVLAMFVFLLISVVGIVLIYQFLGRLARGVFSWVWTPGSKWVFTLVVVVGFLLIFLPDDVSNALLVIIGLCGGVAAVVWKVRRDLIAGTEEDLRRAAVIAVIVLAIATLLVAAGLTMEARTDGGAVLKGEVQHANGGSSIPLSSWAADAASITWIGSSPPPDELTVSSCFLYLGRNDASIVLFDPRTQQSIRAPSGDVLVLVDSTVEDGEAACQN